MEELSHAEWLRQQAHRLRLTGSRPLDADFSVALTDGLERIANRISSPEVVTVTEEMWGGLARDIMMWLDMHPKTPRTLFKHLECTGREIPDWLRNEPEMLALDHVPSKGTRCVLIYKAMQEAALSKLSPLVQGGR